MLGMYSFLFGFKSGGPEKMDGAPQLKSTILSPIFIPSPEPMIGVRGVRLDGILED